MLITNENYMYMIWNYTPTLLLKKYKFRIILCCPWRHLEKKSCVNLGGRQTLYWYMNKWWKHHVSICHRFCTIQVQSSPSIGKFPYFRNKIAWKSSKKAQLLVQKMTILHGIYFSRNLSKLLLERIGQIWFR